MNDYNKIFIDGQNISAFVKDTNRIWEGIIVTRSDGTKVALNETTKTWKRLSDLNHIKRVGVMLYEEEKQEIPELKTFGDLINHSFSDVGKVDPSKINDKNLGDVSKSLTDIGTDMGLSDTPDEDKAKTLIGSELALKNAEGEKTEGAGDNQQKEEAMENISKFKQEIGDNIKESLKRLHPMLRVLTEELDEDMTEEEAEARKEMIDEQEALEYEDSDYLDISSDQKREIIEKAYTMLEDGQNDIEDELKASYELNDEDAEEFAIAAMEKYLDNTEVEPRNSIKTEDDVEEDFEDTIDKFDGPTDELLDHLVDEYEIDPDEAESIWVEKKGNLEECIFAFVDIIKKRLNEASFFKTYGGNWDTHKLTGMWKGTQPADGIGAEGWKKWVEEHFEGLYRENKDSYMNVVEAFEMVDDENKPHYRVELVKKELYEIHFLDDKGKLLKEWRAHNEEHAGAMMEYLFGDL